jgi:deazaflavin-dependent oxidoreductase (nitroreductase family)
MDVMKIADRIWPVTRNATKLHTLAYRATGGRFGHHFPGAPPSLLLDHVGAKSGKKRTTPLVYTRDGDNVVIVASKGGYPKNPGWYHNLRANPDTTIQVGSKRWPVHARVAEPAERARLWPSVIETYSGYGDYQRRTERQIPLVILEPRAS